MRAPGTIEFSCVYLPSGVRRRICGLSSMAAISISFWRGDEIAGRMLLFSDEVHVVEAGIRVARGPATDGAQHIAEILTNGGLRIRVWVAGATLHFGRERSCSGERIGRPISVGGAELDALARATEWLRLRPRRSR